MMLVGLLCQPIFAVILYLMTGGFFSGYLSLWVLAEQCVFCNF